MKLWNPEDGSLIDIWAKWSVYSVAFSPDGEVQDRLGTIQLNCGPLKIAVLFGH